MPNWCSNNITIQGPVDKIRALWDAAQPAEGKDGLLLEAMAPIGEWDYDTAVNTWGTKWDISLEGLQFELLPDGRAMIHGWFESAWSPPTGAYEQFCENNDDVYICASYFEPGMGFIGIWDNEVIGDVCYDDVPALIESKAADEDIQLAELFDEFGVESWYDFEEEEEMEE